MARIPYPLVEDLAASVRQTVESAKLNALTMFAHATPAAFDSFFAFTAAFFTASKLPADLRQIGILRSGHLSGSLYVTRQHESLARGIGLSDAAIAAIREGGAQEEVLTPAQQAVLTFSDEVIIDVRASDATLDAVRQHLDDNQLMDLMMVIGLYMTMARMIETAGVELDEHAISVDHIDEMHG